MTVDPHELAAAQAVIARYECHAGGHDFGIATDDHGAPVQVVCSRPCGHGPWSVTAPGDQGVPYIHLLLADGSGHWACCGQRRNAGEPFTRDRRDVTCTGAA